MKVTFTCPYCLETCVVEIEDQEGVSDTYTDYVKECPSCQKEIIIQIDTRVEKYR